MSDRFEFRSYQEGDDENIQRLLAQCFKDWPGLDLRCTQLEHWKWKYNENGLIGKVITVALENKVMIGVTHAYLKNVKIFDSYKLGKYGSDTAVHPDYRRLGVKKGMSPLHREKGKEAGVDFSYRVSSNPIMVKSWEKRRPRFPHEVLNLVWIDDLNRQLKEIPMKNSLFLKTGFSMLKMLNKIGSVFNKSDPSLCSLSWIEKFDTRIDEFWDKNKQHYQFITVRDRKYLNWRFCDPRAGNYKVLQAEENGKICGYCVLLINNLNKKYPIGYILEVLALPQMENVAESLIAKAMDYFKQNNVNIVNSQIIKGHPYEDILKKTGFIDSRIRLHLFYRYYNEDDLIKKLTEASPSQIYFNYSDIDSLPSSLPTSR